ncbi:hypothetical protein [Streptomyces goshikiensis]|uniref:hypothetical protein n=1 Tax=Streptomyces goshikiensis TaxID=1942 RepID=UPI00365AAD62
MPRFTIPLTTHANITVDVLTDASDPAAIAALALDAVEETELCQQCATEIDLDPADWAVGANDVDFRVTRLGEGRWRVTLTTHANTAVDLETDTATPDPAALALQALEALDLRSPCHQCERLITIGDTWRRS